MSHLDEADLQDRECRIVRKLQPGEYWLTVRHKQPAATGQYSIGISRRRN